MKRNVKRLFSILLALVMVFSLFPVNVFAEEAEDPDPVEQLEEDVRDEENEGGELPAEDPAAPVEDAGEETAEEPESEPESDSVAIASGGGTRDAYVFTVQPQSGSFDPDTMEYHVTWETNFVPEQIIIQRWIPVQGWWEDETLTTGLGTSGSYDIPVSTAIGTATRYNIKAFYTSGNYDFIISNTFDAYIDAFLFSQQPQSGSINPNTMQYLASWETTFVPVKIEIERYSGAMGSYYVLATKTENLQKAGYYNCPVTSQTGDYRIKAYYAAGDNDYIKSNSFYVDHDGVFWFTEHPLSGTYDPNTLEYVATWKTNFLPVKVEIQCNVYLMGFTTIKTLTENLSRNGSYCITNCSGTETYRILAFYADGNNDYLTSATFLVSDQPVATSGTCGANGDNLTWNYASQTLTISGSGAMANFTSATIPWRYYQKSIHSVVVEEGVSTIGNYAFYNSPNLSAVHLPSTLESIGNYAFNTCPALADAYINMSQQAFDANVSWYKATNGGLNSAAKHFNCFAEGQAGPNLTWQLSDAGRLSFSGSGAMYDWSSSNKAPWYSCRNNITIVNLTNCDTVGDYAFYQCTNITGITILSTVSSLGEHAFSGCTGLATVGWDTGIYSIPEIPAYCFSGCSALQHFRIPKSCTGIGESAFSGCSALTSVTNSSNTVLTGVGNRAFYNCCNLSNISLPDSVTGMGSYAFYGCSSLTSFPLPSGLTSLGDYCFAHCTGVTGTVTIPSGVTGIPSRCFSDSSGFNKLVLGSGLTTVGGYAFAGCSALTRVEYDGFPAQWENEVAVGQGNAPLTSASFSWLFRNGTLSSGVNWSLYGGSGKLQIWGSGAMPDWDSSASAPWYQYRNYIQIIDVQTGITHIGTYTFSNYTAINTVHLPTSVTLIGYGAFLSCTSLNDVWYNGSELMRQAKLTINSQNYALLNAQWHYTDIIGSVTGTDLSWSFDPNSGILRVYWDEDNMDQNAMAIHDYVDGRDTPWYQYNNGQLIPMITAVQVDELVTGIGNYAFSGLSALTDVQIASTVTRIGEGAFMGCDSLMYVDLPDTVQTLDENVFWDCDSLEIVTLPAGITTIPSYTFYSCDDLYTVYIPGTVTGIGNNAFSGTDMATGHVYFNGTSAQWAAVSKGSGNGALDTAAMHFTPPEIAVDAVNFPDPAFRAYVADEIDTDSTGWLTVEECLDVSTIYCANSNIASLEGIAYFPNLTHLDCSYNAIVSALDLTGNPMLQSVNAGSNQIQALNVTGLEMLTTLIFSDNDTGMNAPDLSTNTALTYLDCRNCDGLENLNLSANAALTDLDCSWNQLEALNLSANVALQQLNCSRNSIAVLDLSNNTDLRQVNCMDNVLTTLTLGQQPQLITLSCYANSISTVDLTGCPVLMDAVLNGTRTEKTNTGWHNYTYVEYRNGANYVQVDSSTALYTSPEGIPVDAAHFPDAIFCAYVAENFDNDHDGYLTDAECEAVEAIDVIGKGISSLEGIEYFCGLITLDAGNNNLTTLDLSENLHVRSLCLNYNNLTTLNLSANTALVSLSCGGNGLTALDLSHNTALTTLSCYESSLTTLDVSMLSNLEYLECGDNDLTELDLHANTALEHLDCSGNLLTELDVSCCPSLSWLNCRHNPLIALDVSNCPGLMLVRANAGTDPEFGLETDFDESAIIMAPAAPVLDKSYVMLNPGRSTMLKVLNLSDIWAEYIAWTIETGDPFNPDQDLATITGDGLNAVVTASESDIGTVWVQVGYNIPGLESITTRCRVDVESGNDINGVQLIDNKATVELFRTDYTVIEVIPLLEQNLTPMSPIDDAGAITGGDTGLPPTGGITSAEFVDPAAKAAFSLKVLDDRRLAVVPTAEALENPGSVAGKYSSAIAVSFPAAEGSGNTLDTYQTDALALTVKKSTPKLKASAVKFNSFIPDDSVSLSVSVTNGGTVIGYEVPDKVNGKPVTVPDFVDLSSLSDGILKLKDGSAKSGKLWLRCTVEGWSVPADIQISVSKAVTKPSLAVKPAALTLSPYSRDMVSAAVNITPAVFDNASKYPVAVTKITEGSVTYEGDTLNDALITRYTPYDHTLRIILNESSGIDYSKAHTYKLFLSISVGENEVSKAITVKTRKTADWDSPVIVTAKAAGSIDTAVSMSPIIITGTLKNLSVELSEDQWDVVIESNKDLPSGLCTDDLFHCSDHYPFTITAKDEARGTIADLLAQKYSFSAVLYACPGVNVPTASKAVKLSIKASKTAPKVSVALKAAGSVDVIRPASAITLTPTVKNWYLYTPEAEDFKIYEKVGSNYEPLTSERFTVTPRDGSFVVTVKDGVTLNTKNKYFVRLETDIGRTDTTPGLMSGYTALKLTMGKVKLSNASVTADFLKSDRFSNVIIRPTSADTGLGSVVNLTFADSNTELSKDGRFELVPQGYGSWMLRFAGNELPPNLKTATVKLNVFYDGNFANPDNPAYSGKPTANAVLTVKINIK